MPLFTLLPRTVTFSEAGGSKVPPPTPRSGVYEGVSVAFYAPTQGQLYHVLRGFVASCCDLLRGDCTRIFSI